MKVKGTSLKTTRDFVKSKFPLLYDKWQLSLPEKSKTLLSSTIDSTAWYPFIEGFIIPANKIAEVCYQNNKRAAGVEMGEYSAEIALKGFYKVFLLIASPQFLLQRASKIFTTYYEPSKIEAEIEGSNHGILRVIDFEGVDEVIEYRIAGWVKKALELANCKETRYEITQFLSKGSDSTEIHFYWQ